VACFIMCCSWGRRNRSNINNATASNITVADNILTLYVCSQTTSATAEQKHRAGCAVYGF
jgi:hypothetical protein